MRREEKTEKQMGKYGKWKVRDVVTLSVTTLGVASAEFRAFQKKVMKYLSKHT